MLVRYPSGIWRVQRARRGANFLAPSWKIWDFSTNAEIVRQHPLKTIATDDGEALGFIYRGRTLFVSPAVAIRECIRRNESDLKWTDGYRKSLLRGIEDLSIRAARLSVEVLMQRYRWNNGAAREPAWFAAAREAEKGSDVPTAP